MARVVPDGLCSVLQKVGGGWSQLSGLKERLDPLDERQMLEERQRQEEAAAVRRAQEPEKMVHESIYRLFRDTERREPPVKSRYPPPAHSSKPPQPPPDKPVAAAPLPKLAEPSFSLMGYMPNYLKEPPPPQAAKLHDRSPYSSGGGSGGSYHDHREKASVIIQPEAKYDKGPPPAMALSPKHRPPERTSPFPPSSAYKPHDPSPALSSVPHTASSAATLHRSVPGHHPPSMPHGVELAKARPPSSPHPASVPGHPDRYYTSSRQTPTTYTSSLITAGLVPNPIHVSVAAKAKVGSPPPQMYGKPGITTGTPVCRPDTRPAQPVPLTSKAPTPGPPPAHSGRPAHPHAESRPPPMPPHEQRPYDARIYPPPAPSPHHKHVVAPGPPAARLPPTTSPHLPAHPSLAPQPTQTQPLDLNTREDAASPAKRRTATPSPQDTKKARYDPSVAPPSQPPLLSRVSEPSPLYPAAATTITTVENPVALADSLPRVGSPVSRPPSRPPAVGTPTATTPQPPRTENSSPPGGRGSAEPEKSVSPGPVGGYVHKLKKAWLQRHENTAEPSAVPPSSGTSLAARVTTPPPTTPSSSPPAKASPAAAASVKMDANKPGQRKPKPPNNIPNGHSQEAAAGGREESTSSDSEGGAALGPAGMRNKRGKAKRKIKKIKRGSGSGGGGSDTNSDSDKDSDGSETAATKGGGRLASKPDVEPKKRGRKPKTKQEKEREDSGPKAKKIREDAPPGDPLQKPPVAQLKKTGESFLQDGSCYEVAPKLPKCRECRWTPHQRNKKMPNIFCRFYAFRRLRYTKNGQLAVAGFSDPIKDAFGDDLKLWLPDVDNTPSDLDVDISKFLLTHVGDQFCDLVEQEKEAMALHMGDDSVVAWKRVVQGVREMCDVCETTLFNIHWACSKCGFVVCIDCYKGRKNGTVKVWDEGGKDRDEYSWLLCASRLPHEQDKLMLTQIISGNALLDLGRKVHLGRHQWSIPQYCECPEAKRYKDQVPEDDKKKVNGVNKELLKTFKKEPKVELVNGAVKAEKVNGKEEEEMSNSPLNFFADVALSNDKRESESSDSDSDSDSDEKEGNFSTLRKLLIQPNGNTKEEPANAAAAAAAAAGARPAKESSKKRPKLDTVDEVISSVIDHSSDKDDSKDNNQVVLKHFIRKYNYGPRGRDPLPIRIMTKTESSLLYPGVAHSWLCDGKLLRLLEPLAPGNTPLFQDMWKRGQPVIVSGVGQKLNADLWTPQSFSKDYGDIKNDLINCLTGNIVPNQPMRKFWDGFENYGKRLKDEKGQPMVLKLKDWPPGDDFAEMLPSRFEDLMNVLPMGEYTRRNGRLNLAGRLPECFVRPDLGPKMYIAYGSAIHPNRASTNLHLDISDAVNVMCYVGVPKDADYQEHVKEVFKAIDEAGCDILTRRRVREKEEVPGALWHIYHARDSDKIRDLLNKVAIERGDKLEPHHDPIHDQAWYLDGPLRERLYKEYGVEGYAIIQCLGDAVFIPAGAPHQVRNLHNCVKVAEDFVSPENVSYCFHLTQEFRHLSDTHTNHEDKLQIKNIIYHAMKDSMACLLSISKEAQVKEEESDTPSPPAATTDKKRCNRLQPTAATKPRRASPASHGNASSGSGVLAVTPSCCWVFLAAVAVRHQVAINLCIVLHTNTRTNFTSKAGLGLPSGGAQQPWPGSAEGVRGGRPSPPQRPSAPRPSLPSLSGPHAAMSLFLFILYIDLIVGVNACRETQSLAHTAPQAQCGSAGTSQPPLHQHSFENSDGKLKISHTSRNTVSVRIRMHSQCSWLTLLDGSTPKLSPTTQPDGFLQLPFVLCSVDPSRDFNQT
ncbi:lysine-specific demethylase 3A-A-like [Portunus trituberculatus]|uniref:lysine-specific demethylase 3A-A-like n=1 Tax=Portunus trituberculatus TaxID=210409 RepID=UPI001E1CC01E|nr:lysine-specific demethylase 3A-A-like [Portunus trituberculatus]